MEIHAVIGIGPNKVYVRDTSCYCINCFLSAFKKLTCCDGWREVDMRRNDAKKAKTKSRDEKQPAQSTRVPVNLKRRAPVNTSSAPAFSSAGVVIEVDDFTWEKLRTLTNLMLLFLFWSIRERCQIYPRL